MAKRRVKNKQPIMGCLTRHIRETGMSGLGHYLWWAFCIHAIGNNIISNYLIVTIMEKYIC
ncbi:MAG: hypothetical protein WC472_02960, partial [Candidatus Paceibacterota bacterium]